MPDYMLGSEITQLMQHQICSPSSRALGPDLNIIILCDVKACICFPTLVCGVEACILFPTLSLTDKKDVTTTMVKAFFAEF